MTIENRTLRRMHTLLHKCGDNGEASIPRLDDCSFSALSLRLTSHDSDSDPFRTNSLIPISELPTSRRSSIFQLDNSSSRNAYDISPASWNRLYLIGFSFSSGLGNLKHARRDRRSSSLCPSADTASVSPNASGTWIYKSMLRR